MLLGKLSASPLSTRYVSHPRYRKKKAKAYRRHFWVMILRLASHTDTLIHVLHVLD